MCLALGQPQTCIGATLRLLWSKRLCPLPSNRPLAPSVLDLDGHPRIRSVHQAIGVANQETLPCGETLWDSCHLFDVRVPLHPSLLRFPSLSLSVSLALIFSPSLCLSLCLSLSHVSLHHSLLYLFLSLSLSICLSFARSVCLSVCPSVRPSVRPSVVCLSVCLSVCLPLSSITLFYFFFFFSLSLSLEAFQGFGPGRLLHGDRRGCKA